MENGCSWQREIAFKCEFGVWPFRKTLEITPNGFVWCGELVPMRKITKLRWGVDQKRGGILPRRTFIAVFGTKTRDFIIKTKQKDFYEHLTDKYWVSVGKRILSEMLSRVKNGGAYDFGDFYVSDGGVTVKGRTFLCGGAREEFYAFEDLNWGIVNGSLCFTHRLKPDKVLAGASFLWVDNVCILNVALGLMSRVHGKKLSCAAACDV